MIVGIVLIFIKGINKLSKVKEGIVWNILVIWRIIWLIFL